MRAVRWPATPRPASAAARRRSSCVRSWLTSRRRGLGSGRGRRRGDATEIGRLVGAARALPARDLRIETERPGAIDFPGGAVRGDQLVRCHTLFDPLLECGEVIELVRAGAA